MMDDDGWWWWWWWWWMMMMMMMMMRMRMMYDVWCMMYDVWCMMYDVWCMMYDVWWMMDDGWWWLWLSYKISVCVFSAETDVWVCFFWCSKYTDAWFWHETAPCQSFQDAGCSRRLPCWYLLIRIQYLERWRTLILESTLPETNIAMENPPFWWYLPGNMGIFHGYVSLQKGIFNSETSAMPGWLYNPGGWVRVVSLQQGTSACGVAHVTIPADGIQLDTTVCKYLAANWLGDFQKKNILIPSLVMEAVRKDAELASRIEVDMCPSIFTSSWRDRHVPMCYVAGAHSVFYVWICD